MFTVSSELIDKIKYISSRLKETYDRVYDREQIRQKLIAAGAEMSVVEPFKRHELARVLANREIAAVDGSVNQTSGEDPHVLYFFQALAKTTSGYKAFTSDVYTPLIEQDENETNVHKRKQILAKLELEAALQLLEERDIAFLLMDGALYHYRIDAPDEWEQLKEKALEKEVLLVGVSEEITTDNLQKIEPFSNWRGYDRDVLFGVLAYKEMVYVEKIQQKAGLVSVWCRFSRDPAITGFDMLTEQQSEIKTVARLLLTLTPENGRGVPLFIDIVDREVRLSDDMVEAFIEQYIDVEIRRRLFVKKRHDRPY